MICIGNRGARGLKTHGLDRNTGLESQIGSFFSDQTKEKRVRVRII